MKQIVFWLMVLVGLIIVGNVFGYNEMGVYTKLYKVGVLTTGDIVEIHKSLSITGECLGLGIGKGYITVNDTDGKISIKEIVLNVCDQKTFEYMLLHEIGHFVDWKYDIRVPLFATTEYSKTSTGEMYAESFAKLYY